MKGRTVKASASMKKQHNALKTVKIGGLCLLAMMTWSSVASAQESAVEEPAAVEVTSASVDTVALPEAEESGAPSSLSSPPRAQVVSSPARDAFDAAIKESLEGERQKLIPAFQALVNDEEVGVHAIYNLGVLAWERGDRDEANARFQEALEKRPGFGPAVVALVREALSRNDVSAAESIVARQRQASEDASGARTGALYISLHRNDWSSVIRDTRGVLIDNPNDIDAHFALAMAYLGMGRHELAEYVLNSASRRDASRADIQYGLGRVALARGRTEEARSFFEEATRRAPAFPEATIDLAALRLANMDYAPVVETLTEVTKVVPNLAAAWVTLGSGLKGMRRYAEAKAAFEHALTLDPNSWSATFNLGILYLDVQGFEELDQLARMAKVSEYFAKYRQLRGTLPANDPVTAYEAYVAEEILMQEELARQAAEDAERERRRAEAAAAREAQQQEGGSEGGGESGSSGDDWDDWDDW